MGGVAVSLGSDVSWVVQAAGQGAARGRGRPGLGLFTAEEQCRSLGGLAFPSDLGQAPMLFCVVPDWLHW